MDIRILKEKDGVLERPMLCRCFCSGVISTHKTRSMTLIEKISFKYPNFAWSRCWVLKNSDVLVKQNSTERIIIFELVA